MLYLFLFIISSAELSADQAFQTQDDTINDFSIIEDRVYVATPNKTYLLNKSLSVDTEFSKKFHKSLLFYANSDFLLECGQRLTDNDDCCLLRDPLSLTEIASTSSSELCKQFVPTRFHYPCYGPKKKGTGYNFYMLISYFSRFSSGRFSRIWFPQIKNNSLDYKEEGITGFNGIVQFRPKVLSPDPTTFRKYVVIRKSVSIPAAHYFNPDIELLGTQAQGSNNNPGNPVAALECDNYANDVRLGFGIPGGSQPKVKDILSVDKLTHFVLFNNSNSYRVCSYTEDTEMMPTTEQHDKLTEISKDSVFNISTDVGVIKSFKGRLVNDEVVILYSIGQDVHKIVYTEDDSKGDGLFRDLDIGILFSASSNVNKLEFFNDDLVYASTDSSIETFVPHKCAEYPVCSIDGHGKKGCNNLGDPHCGWCTLQNSCTTRAQCTVKPELWVKKPSQCLEISIPDTNKDVMSGLNLVISARNVVLPNDLKYTCRFSSGAGEVRVSNGTCNGSEITCPVPDFSDINSGLMLLDVDVLYDNSPIGADQVRYHRCDLYTQCADCSDISKYCAWCPLEGSCNKTQETVCQEYKVTDPAKCPKITKTIPDKLPRNTIKTVVVDVSNLPDYQLDTPVYQCMISSRANSSVTRYFKIDKRSKNDTIFCDGVQVQQEFPEFNTAESDIDISIVYGTSADTSGVIVAVSKLSVYACGLLARDCVQCVSSYSAEYNCRFCADRCSYTSNQICEKEAIADNRKCLAKNTKIEKIVPDWSPGEGGVPVTITGKSLARLSDNIDILFIYKDKANNTKQFKCDDSKIIDSTRLTCITPTSPNIMEQLKKQLLHVAISTTIRIKYKDGAVTDHNSKEKFIFTPLDISHVTPSVGPESGGTLVRVNGTKLCVPGNTSVTIGNGNACDSVSCVVANSTSQTVTCVSPAGIGSETVTVFLGAGSVAASTQFSYGPDPVVDEVHPNNTLAQGGLNISVIGRNFNVIQRPQLVINKNNLEKSVVKRSDDTSCDFSNVTEVDAVNRTDNTLVFTLPAIQASSYKYSFKMDGVTALCQTERTIVVQDAPKMISSSFLEENSTQSCDIGSPCHINFTMTQIHLFGDQVRVVIGNLECINATVEELEERKIGRFVCVVPSLDDVKESLFGPDGGRTKRALLGDQESDRFPVKLKIGHYQHSLGWLAYVEKGFQMMYIYVGAGVFLVFLVIFIVLVVKNRHDKHHIIDLEKKHQHEIDKVEATYAKAARQEFTELTLMTGHTANIKIDPREIPYRIYCDYLVHIMFPNVDKRKILNNLQLDQCEVPDYQIQEFRKFLNNQQFIITFIDVIERQREFQVAHRCEVASYLTIALYSDFSYLSKILFTLLDTLIKNDINKTPKLLLRATKSVAEKLLTNWLSLALYDYLCNMTGPSLYDLCYKILLTVELGPLDFVTHQARFALSQDKILSEEVEFKKLEVQAEGPDGTRAKNPVPVLDCDTITQVKGKLYRAIYRHQPFSQQPALETLSLLWTPKSGNGQSIQTGSMELCDYDERMIEMGAEKKFNTLKSYKVQSDDLLTLTMFNDYHQAPMSTIRSVKRQTVSEVSRYHLVKNINSDMDFRSPAVNKRQISTSSTTKIASEAYLPSLIRTKEHLAKVFDSMMVSVFMESNNIPAAIKCLFDYLDSKTELLSERDRQDPEIAHVWKTNSLPLRFWINIIKNPQFLFDIEKPPIMDSYLSVIGQCFMDSFSLATMTLNKDSSANKLVYNKEVNQYRKAVDKWYRDVRQAPPVTLRGVVADSKLPALPFRTKFAVSQLFNYARKYQSEIAAALPTQGQHITRSDFEVLTKPRS